MFAFYDGRKCFDRGTKLELTLAWQDPRIGKEFDRENAKIKWCLVITLQLLLFYLNILKELFA